MRNVAPLDEEIVKHFTCQIVDAVVYIHSQNIIHLDIKGDNILLTPDGICKLCDFGLARRIKAPLKQSLIGTIQFMPPEVINVPEGGYGLPADVWSVGCTVVEMVGRELSFCGIDLGAILFKVGMFKTHPKIPDEASEDCVKFLDR